MSSTVCTKVKGYASAFGVSASAAMIILSAKYLNSEVPAFETNMFRFIFQTLAAILLLLIFRTNPCMPCNKGPVAVMLGSIVVTFAAGVLFILSSWYLPVAVVYAFMETTIMILSGIVAIFKKTCSVFLPFVIVICSAGCLLLSQPYFIFGEDFLKQEVPINRTNLNMSISNSSGLLGDEVDNTQQIYGYLCVMALGVCLWIHTQFNVTYLVQYTTVTSVLFWLGSVCFVISLPVVFLVETPIPVKEPFLIGMIILFSVAFTINNELMMVTVTLIPLSHASLILPTSLIFLFIFQKTILKDMEPGPDNWLEIVGFCLVLLGSFMTPICDIGMDRYLSLKKPQETLDEKTHLLMKRETLV